MARYKATATIIWEFDHIMSNTNPTEVAQAKLIEILSNTSNVSSKVRVDRACNEKKIIWGEVSPDDVLEHITSDVTRREYVVGGQKHLVKMNSQRYFIFAVSRDCVACGLKGTKMFLEQHANDKSPHFDLYGIEDNELVMLTKDHIRAKAWGGEDRHSNYQTMCAICNNLKGSDNISLEGIRELRLLYGQIKNEVSTKKAGEIIYKRKDELKLPHAWNKEIKPSEKKDSVTLISDILVVEIEGALTSVSVYDGVSESVQLACVSYGTVLHPVGIEGNLLRIPFGDRTFMLHRKFTNWKEQQKCKLMKNKPKQSKRKSSQ